MRARKRPLPIHRRTYVRTVVARARKNFFQKSVDKSYKVWYYIGVEGSKGRAVPTDECADTCPSTRGGRGNPKRGAHESE